MKSLSTIISDMKMVWIYVMLGSLGGFVALLVSSLDSYESKGIGLVVVVKWILCFVFAVTSVVAFWKARKLGRIEDQP